MSDLFRLIAPALIGAFFASVGGGVFGALAGLAIGLFWLSNRAQFDRVRALERRVDELSRRREVTAGILPRDVARRSSARYAISALLPFPILGQSAAVPSRGGLGVSYGPLDRGALT